MLDADWQQARRQPGYTDTAPIGRAVALSYRMLNLPGFQGLTMAETGWQELYTEQAYERFTALRNANSADPAQMNAVDVARLEGMASGDLGSPLRMQAAQTLIRIVIVNSGQRAAAYDAANKVIDGTTRPYKRELSTFIKSQFDGSTAAEVRARLAGLVLAGAPDDLDWLPAALQAITPRSRSGNAADAWAIDALNEHLSRLERLLEEDVARPRADLNGMTGANVTVTRNDTNVDLRSIDGTTTVDPFSYNDPDQQRRQTALVGIRDSYVTYAGKVLDVLDLFPNQSARSRLLNALEVVSGKLVEDGEMEAAQIVLRQERDTFWNAGPQGVFDREVWSLVSRRAHTYGETVPSAVIADAEWMRAGAQDNLDNLDTYSLNADDRAYLQGLANEAIVQSQLLRASASNTVKALSLGLLQQFDDLGRSLISRQFPLTTVRRFIDASATQQTGGFVTVTERPAEYDYANDELTQILTAMRQRVGEVELPTLPSLISNVGADPVVASTSDAGPTPAPLWPLLRSVPRLLDLLRAFGQISVGATEGSDAQVLAGKAAICRILIAAGDERQAGRYIQNFLISDRSRTAQNIAANLLDDQASRRFWQDARQGAINFAATELPILLATSVLSCGTVSAAYATWRVATGIRLSARVLMAAQMVAEVPIASIISGQPLDTTATGLLRQAGMMLGSGLAGRVIGRLGQTAISALRGRMGFAVGGSVVQYGMVGGARTGLGLSGLNNAQNLVTVGVRLQGPKSTCGLYAALSAIENIPTRNQLINFSGIRSQIRGNNGRGLNSQELVNFISRNTGTDVFAQLERNVTETRLLELLSQNRVIAHVEGNPGPARTLGNLGSLARHLRPALCTPIPFSVELPW